MFLHILGPPENKYKFSAEFVQYATSGMIS
jgi:hypothetical protein